MGCCEKLTYIMESKKGFLSIPILIGKVVAKQLVELHDDLKDDGDGAWEEL